MVEVNQLRKKTIFFIILGRIKQKNKQMLLKGGGGGGCNPLNPSTPGSASVSSLIIRYTVSSANFEVVDTPAVHWEKPRFQF